MDTAIVDEFEKNMDLLYQLESAIVKDIANANWEKAKKTLVEQYSPMCKQTRDTLQEKLALIQPKIHSKIDQNQELARIGLYSAITPLLVIILLSIFSLIRVIRGIMAPLTEIEYAAKQLVNGELSTQISYESKDEMGSLACSIRKAIESLDSYVRAFDTCMLAFSNGNFVEKSYIEFAGDFKSIKTSIESFQTKMNETLNELSIASWEVSGGASQVADSSQQLAKGATEQASSVQKLRIKCVKMRNIQKKRMSLESKQVL